MTIRTATINDLNAIAAVEAECFPPTEAATRDGFTAGAVWNQMRLEF